mmetsp:Transcript_17780/g.58182  ORF Transcript_17780/g.58182 Transcript_17780/m.58182 type:complete len:305 (-) Transcript_17780:1019-1933(-)
MSAEDALPPESVPSSPPPAGPASERRASLTAESPPALSSSPLPAVLRRLTAKSDKRAAADVLPLCAMPLRSAPGFHDRGRPVSSLPNTALKRSFMYFTTRPAASRIFCSTTSFARVRSDSCRASVCSGVASIPSTCGPISSHCAFGTSSTSLRSDDQRSDGAASWSAATAGPSVLSTAFSAVRVRACNRDSFSDATWVAMSSSSAAFAESTAASKPAPSGRASPAPSSHMPIATAAQRFADAAKAFGVSLSPFVRERLNAARALLRMRSSCASSAGLTSSRTFSSRSARLLALTFSSKYPVSAS